MNTKGFFRKESLMDKRAVSPVIGEILMVAIVVIIAAVLAAFIFGISPTTEKTPHVQLKATVTVSDNKLTLKHLGGEPISLDDCLIKVKGTEVTGTFSGDLTVGMSKSAAHGATVATGESVTVEVIHLPSESYILDTVVTAQ